MMYFKIRTGYKAMDFINIDETELAMAKRAQLTGKVAQFVEGDIAGNHIISITPNWNKEMGYHADYAMTGEDMESIPRKIQMGYRLLLENTNNEVQAQIEGRPIPPKIEAPNRMHTQGLTSIGDILKLEKKKCIVEDCKEEAMEKEDYCKFHSFNK